VEWDDLNEHPRCSVGHQDLWELYNQGNETKLCFEHFTRLPLAHPFWVEQRKPLVDRYMRERGGIHPGPLR